MPTVPRSAFEDLIIGEWRRIIFKDGSSRFVDRVTDVLYDIDGQPSVLLCNDGIYKWEMISHVTFRGED